VRLGDAGAGGGRRLKFVPIPVILLEVGQPLPVNLYSDDGTLLLRKGQPVVSIKHQEKLHTFNASALEADALAWQRAYERMVHMLINSGADLQEIASAHMPRHIHTTDYLIATQLAGGWLDLQEVLRGILYQGGLSINPMPRLLGMQQKMIGLIEADADESLFALYQALRDASLGYCATHGLLCALLCELTAIKLNIPASKRVSLMAAAMTMNIGMARDQDRLARQAVPVTAWQRDVIKNHPERSVAVLEALGVVDPDQLDMVRWHHQWDNPQGLASNLVCRRLLFLADAFVARTAARKTRSSLAPVEAVKSLVIGASGDTLGVGSAMAQAVSFYPPGTYVQLQSGEIAVSVQRGERANTPWVISIMDRDSMPITTYVCRNTAEPAYAIRGPENAESVRVMVQVERVLRARARIPKIRG